MKNKFSFDAGFDILRGGMHGSVAQTQQDNGETVVLLKNEEQYALRFSASYDTRYKIEVYLDGRRVANNLIIQNGSVLERGTAEGSGIFTFYALGSEGGNAAGLDQLDPAKLGLVEVVFFSEKAKQPVYRSSGDDLGLESYRSGGVGGSGMSGVSSQTFGTTNFEVDEAAPVIRLAILLRVEPGARPLMMV